MELKYNLQPKLGNNGLFVKIFKRRPELKILSPFFDFPNQNPICIMQLMSIL